MTNLPILKFPDPRLRRISEPVTVFDKELADLAEDMRETMILAPGVGLAAPQVDRLIRMIVCDWADEGEEFGQHVITLVNPRITRREGKQCFDEGCLSVKELTASVNRAEMVEVEAQTTSGEAVTISAEGRKAVILQHEIDHLDGILFIDHLSRLKREILLKPMTKAAKKKKKDDW